MGTINSKEESFKKKIENQINTNKQTFSEVEKFSLDLVNTKIAEFSAYIEYDSAKQLFDSANGI